MSDSECSSGHYSDSDDVNSSDKKEVIERAFEHNKNPPMIGAVDVRYCPVCTLPPLYCEVGPSPANCVANWLEEDKMYYLELCGKSEEELKDIAKGASEAPKVVKKKDTGPAQILVQTAARGKRKTVTIITNLEKFDIKLDAAAKHFQKKFACGAAVVKNANPGLPDMVEIQGDFEYDVADVICKEWKTVDIKSILILQAKK